ncbi:DUF4158 domain-containing protein [Nonomuraea sp. NPDC051191]|uniref:DUF4158 domain-containing protein n=1 Tax=Nonomuraea sp. NPDC051191 TaxID=3364372 RepID=UPI00379DF514
MGDTGQLQRVGTLVPQALEGSVNALDLTQLLCTLPSSALQPTCSTDTDEHLLALTLALKCFQRLGRFAKAREVPVVVVEQVRRCLELKEDVAPTYASTCTAESHRVLVRRREGAAYAPGKARKIAAKAMTRAAWVKNHPPDLINVALERPAQARLEPPAFSTLDSMESTIRGQANGQIFQTIWRREIGP